MFFFGLSDTASAILWLWEKDRGNWAIGSHAVVHCPTGIGVWTANSAYGLDVWCDVPERSRAEGHVLSGRRVNVGWYDRCVLRNVIIRGQSRAAHEDLQHIVFKFGYEKGLTRDPKSGAP